MAFLFNRYHLANITSPSTVMRNSSARNVSLVTVRVKKRLKIQDIDPCPIFEPAQGSNYIIWLNSSKKCDFDMPKPPFPNTVELHEFINWHKPHHPIIPADD